MRKHCRRLRILCQEIHEFISEHFVNQPDPLSKDLERVMIASRLLQVSEFCFFRIAYYQWFGREIDEGVLECLFREYMFQDNIPHWVRHL